MSGDDPVHPARIPTKRGDFLIAHPGLTKREWLVGQIVASSWFSQRVAALGMIPPLREIWELADRILEAQEKGKTAKGPAGSL